MTYKKLIKNSWLDASEDEWRNHRLIGVVSVLLNILTSIVMEKPLNPRATKFVNRVLTAFNEIYESPSAARMAWAKVEAIRSLRDAYEERESAIRNEMIESVISFIDQWGLNSKPLSAHHIRNLKAAAPRTGPGKDSSIELVLSRLDNMFEYSKSEYWRDVKRWGSLENEVRTLYGNILNSWEVLNTTLRFVFMIKGQPLEDMSVVAWKDGYHTRKYPISDGFRAGMHFRMIKKMRN